MELTSESILEPASGIAMSLATGQRLRVVDLEGQRVVDMAVFNADNPREKLSTSYSRTRAGFAAAGGDIRVARPIRRTRGRSRSHSPA